MYGLCPFDWKSSREDARFRYEHSTATLINKAASSSPPLLLIAVDVCGRLAVMAAGGVITCTTVRRIKQPLEVFT